MGLKQGLEDIVAAAEIAAAEAPDVRFVLVRDAANGPHWRRLGS